MKIFNLCLSVLICLASFAQTELRLGLKIHPNFTFTTAKNSSYSAIKIEHSNAAPMAGLNFGLNTNVLFKDRFLIDVASSIATNDIASRISLEDELGETKTAKMSYKTVSWMNELKMSVKVFSKPKPYYDVFIGINGHANISNVSSFSTSSQANIIIDENAAEALYSGEKFNTYGFGVHAKIRTEVKRFGQFDYGLSYYYELPTYPVFGINSDGNTFSFLPQVHILQVNFAYYFKIWKRG